jgi:hypothetical protein
MVAASDMIRTFLSSLPAPATSSYLAALALTNFIAP